MSFTSLADRQAEFRVKTAGIKEGVGLTFHCCECKQRKSVMGRKSAGRIGRRQLWKCSACATPDGA